MKHEKTVSALKPSLYSEDKLFLEQITAITALANQLQALDELPSFVTVRLSVAPLIAVHSLASPAITDALKLLSTAANELTAAADKAYNGNVVVAIVTGKEDVVRTKRAAGGKSDTIVS